MTPVGKLTWEDGVLKASSPNIPSLAWTRPADLAEARLEIDPPIDALELADGKDLLTAAFAVVPFVRGPLPRAAFGDALTAAAREAFLVYTGQNASSQIADAFRVLRGEPDDYLVAARRYRDVWKVGAFSVAATTLTIRFEDLWNQLPKTAPKYTNYLVEVVRDPHASDGAEAQAAGVVRETLTDIAPDARICVDVAANGGFTLTFWPVAAIPAP